LRAWRPFITLRPGRSNDTAFAGYDSMLLLVPIEALLGNTAWIILVKFLQWLETETFWFGRHHITSVADDRIPSVWI
jgi:hypothetical protein